MTPVGPRSNLKKYRTIPKTATSCSAIKAANHTNAAGCLARLANERKFSVERLTPRDSTLYPSRQHLGHLQAAQRREAMKPDLVPLGAPDSPLRASGAAPGAAFSDRGAAALTPIQGSSGDRQDSAPPRRYAHTVRRGIR